MVGTLKKLFYVRYALHVRLYPELARFQNVSDGNKVLKSVGKQLYSGARYISVVCFLSALVGIPYIYFITSITSHSSWIYLCGTVAIGGLGIPLATIIVPLLLFRQRTRRLLRQELLKKEIPICLHCGYDLSGCPSVRCPECGSVTSRSIAQE